MGRKNNYTGDDLTFVVCAYKECAYLEECIRSLLHQRVRAKVMIATSTPNSHIQQIAERYGLEVRVNACGGQVRDYNFALAQAQTPLVMLAHQDEIFLPEYTKKVLDNLNISKRPIIAFTNYMEMHNDIPDTVPSVLVRIKRLLLLPLKFRLLGKTVFGKRLVQCLGDPITHPTVVCVKKELPKKVFREKYKASMDWDLWERLSKQEGSFVYVQDVLLYHRMNEDNQTVNLIRTTNTRAREEYEILCRFWPRPIAGIIMHFYGRSVKYY